MSQNKIPTAEEFFMSSLVNSSIDKDGNYSIYGVKESMIEFAKLHVEAALKAAHRNIQAPEEDIEFTLESYPLENIK